MELDWVYSTISQSPYVYVINLGYSSFIEGSLFWSCVLDHTVMPIYELFFIVLGILLEETDVGFVYRFVLVQSCSDVSYL